MANKMIFEYPSLTFNELNNDEMLWVVGTPAEDGSPGLPVNPDTDQFTPGFLFRVTIGQLKQLFTTDNWKSPLSAAWGAAGGVALSTTTYNQVSGKSSTFTTIELDTAFVITLASKISSLIVVTRSSQPVTGSLTITLRKNQADTALQIVIPAGSAAGSFSDLVNIVDIAQGDYICYKVVNAATGVSAIITSVGATLYNTV